MRGEDRREEEQRDGGWERQSEDDKISFPSLNVYSFKRYSWLRALTISSKMLTEPPKHWCSSTGGSCLHTWAPLMVLLGRLKQLMTQDLLVTKDKPPHLPSLHDRLHSLKPRTRTEFSVRDWVPSHLAVGKEHSDTHLSSSTISFLSSSRRLTPLVCLRKLSNT